MNDPGNKVNVPFGRGSWKSADANGDKRLSKSEFPKYTAAFWFDACDLDADGFLNSAEWDIYRAALDSENGMLAIRLGGTGDMTESAVRWKYQRSVPQLPCCSSSATCFMVNDNGIITTLSPETGVVLKQGRLTGALAAFRLARRRRWPHLLHDRVRRRRRGRAWR